MTDPNQTPTQVQHPWRATLRTVIAGVVALVPVAPAIVAAAGLDAIPWVISALAVLAAVTRVLAVPQVHDWLAQYMPWLAPSPPTKP